MKIKLSEFGLNTGVLRDYRQFAYVVAGTIKNGLKSGLNSMF